MTLELRPYLSTIEVTVSTGIASIWLKLFEAKAESARRQLAFGSLAMRSAHCKNARNAKKNARSPYLLMVVVGDNDGPID